MSPLLTALRKHWRSKLILTLALPILFMGCYLAVQRWHLVETRQFELGAIDRAVPFRPGWVWVYQSLYLLTPIFPWLATDRRQLRQYLVSFSLTAAVGFLVFWVYPVEFPRPPLAASAPGLYRLQVALDSPGNAFPSLHVALGMVSLLFGSTVLASLVTRRQRRMTLALGFTWLGLIAYSTLATKQHYWVDLPAGLALAGLAHWCSCRWGAQQRIPRSSGKERRCVSTAG